MLKNVIYIYSCVVSVDHVPCGSESQFEKWWQDRNQNPVGVAYPIHHIMISNENNVSQIVFIFCKMWHAISPPDCVLTDYQIVSLEIVYWNIFVTGNILSTIVIAKMF